MAEVRREGRPAAERRAEMNLANPKFVLRNWMAAVAYEAAEVGDTAFARELAELLRRPYDEGTADQAARFFVKTPSWARHMPGVAFYSCSS